MYPAGHARNTNSKIKDLLKHKFEKLSKISVYGPEIPRYTFLLNFKLTIMIRLMERLESLNELTNTELQMLYSSPIKYSDKSIEDPSE